ncbi:hypothetical protein I5677_05690 [Mobilitalea sibirica]|uniref:Uncharacterized protein n=1 Tax=Mobilitalea sibirica TaxID=1462919 RepID=A0A8J7L2E0_9FIRM|nr:hypothetical protein [Mobilitalea sibirica]MBH1940388.1 hypothetical protein [Mobilitalea sibirica]
MIMKFLRSYRTVMIIVFLYILISCVTIAVSMQQVKGAKKDILGCYEFDDCLYMNPLSSFIAVKEFFPYVYGLGEDSMIIANTETGDIKRLSVQYEKRAIAKDEFLSKNDFPYFTIPDISDYNERWLHAMLTDEDGQQYRLYQMDHEIWLIKLSQRDSGIWSIYRLKRTNDFNFSDLRDTYELGNKENEDKLQMTLRDVYELARKGKNLTTLDFDMFRSKSVGSGFTIMRYDIKGGCVLIVHSDTPDEVINYARLSKRGYDPYDESLTVDIRNGTEAVAAYLDPLHSLVKLKIEGFNNGEGAGERELIYEFEGYRYYLNSISADQVVITLENGDRLPLKQALKERRTVIEDLVGNGLYNVFMEPMDNPKGGYFPILHHCHKFTFDNEEFYPSTSFMYMVDADFSSIYFGIEELADVLELWGRDELAKKLRSLEKAGDLFVIADKAYITGDELTEAGITVEIGWAYSSHTPVSFTLVEK